MDSNLAMHRSQLYRFLADAVLYPTDDWTLDLPVLQSILLALNLDHVPPIEFTAGLGALQAAHRRAFGVTGSLCYETEYGLPHEFRQAQELADIAGFYRAFGFTFEGQIHERPDFLASELEFMHILTLKEACAFEAGRTDQAEVCVEAERKFLQDHLGRWIGLFAERFAPADAEGSPYRNLAQWLVAFINADADRVGARPERPRLTEVWPTPLGPEYSCDGCAAAELAEAFEATE